MSNGVQHRLADAAWCKFIDSSDRDFELLIESLRFISGENEIELEKLCKFLGLHMHSDAGGILISMDQKWESEWSRNV